LTLRLLPNDQRNKDAQEHKEIRSQFVSDEYDRQPTAQRMVDDNKADQKPESCCEAFYESCCDCCIRLMSPPTKLVPIDSFPLSLNQRNRLESIRTRCNTRFDRDSPSHRQKLFEFAGVALSSSGGLTESELFDSPKWKTIGFQGKDPSTDFRGAGILGLEQLAYFINKEPAVFQRFLQSQQTEVEYLLPFAIVGLNVTFMLTNFLCITQPTNYQLTPELAQSYRSFIGLLNENENLFDELYAYVLLNLEARWRRYRYRYLDFPVVLKDLRILTSSAFFKQPTSLQQLQQFLTF